MDVVKCILCVNTLDIQSNEFEILGEILNEMLEVVLLKPNFEEDVNPVICKICKENLHKYFVFKATCIDTEDCLFPYINSSAEEVNLTIVYVRERALVKSFKFGENDEVCRFCLSLIKINTATTLTSEISNYGNFFGNFMPEIDLKAAGKALVCESCHVSLEKYVNFIKSCLEKGSQIMKTGHISNLARLESCNKEIKKELMFDKNFSPLKTEQDTDIGEIPLTLRKETAIEKSDKDKDCSLRISKPDIYDDSIHIGEINIKLDKSCESGIFVEGMDRKENIWQISSDFMENTSVTQEEISVNEVSDVTQHEAISKARTAIHKHLDQHENSLNFEENCHIGPVRKTHQSNYDCTSNVETDDYQIQMKDGKKLLHKDVSEIEMFKCALCSYETKNKYRLTTHMINHKKLSDLRMYKCEICSYQTKWKNNLKIHLLIHKDVSDIKMYKCEMCNYQARQKSNLRTHLLIHKNPSDIEMHKCEICNYEVKQKDKLKRHLLIHQKASDVKMYKCELCNYQTKWKSNTKNHMLIHKDLSDIKMFKCEICDYQSKEKSRIKKHLLVHKKPSDMKMFQCEICNHQTKWKGCLDIHMLLHKDPSDIKMYKCEICNYQATRKYHIDSHLLIHKKTSETKMFQCNICNFKTKWRNSIKGHALIHQDPSDIKMFKCEICNFVAIRKSHFKSHLLVHKKTSEMHMFQCDICHYKTKWKGCLKIHVLLHKDPSDIKMFKCEICNYQAKQKCNLKKHLMIHK